MTLGSSDKSRDEPVAGHPCLDISVAPSDLPTLTNPSTTSSTTISRSMDSRTLWCFVFDEVKAVIDISTVFDVTVRIGQSIQDLERVIKEEQMCL